MAKLQIDIPDEVMAKLKAKAALRNQTLKQLINKLVFRATK
jgi:hypothetical protein